MPRPMKAPDAEYFSGDDDRRIFEDLMAGWMHGAPMTERAGNPWMAALLHWPGYAKNRIELSRLLLTIPEREGSYSHADREWADMVLSTHMSTNVVMSGHLPDALGAGVRPEAIAAVRAGREEELTETEKLLADFCRKIVDGGVDDETYGAVEAYMGERATVEYVIFVTVLHETMRQIQALGGRDPSDEEVDQWLREYRDGTREVPGDWRTRAIGTGEGDEAAAPATA